MTRPDQNISRINLVSQINPDSGINPVSRIDPDSRINPNSRINSPIRPTFNIPLTRKTENIRLTRPTDFEILTGSTDSDLPTLSTDFENQTGDVITFAQFEKGDLISEARNDTESGDKSDSKSIMMSKKDMENLEKTEKLIRNCIKQKKLQWKGTLRATHKMGKVLHRVFNTIVSEISQELNNFGETGSEVSNFIPAPRNFAEVTRLAENIRKPRLKATLKEIKNLINSQTFMIEDPKDSVTPCMDVYKAKIQSYGSLDKMKLRIVGRGDLQNKEMIGDTWSPTASMRNLKYFLADAAKHDTRVHQIDFYWRILASQC